MNRTPGVEQIDWSGFTGRSEPRFDELPLSALRGKRVLITGAGGSIGSVLAMAAAQADTRELVLLDQSELGLYELGRALSASARMATRAQMVLGSVCDQQLVSSLFRRHRPEIVFHAAAYKHVPMLEMDGLAAAQVNVLGTRFIAHAAETYHAEQIILLSTDKAADPTSLMGATKRIAECLLLVPSIGDTCRKVVRLGNVLGSSGSVAPVFLEQTMQGVPITVSHPEATRYFFTALEAVHLLLSTAAREVASGLLVPTADPPRRVLDLARFLLAWTGKSPASEIVYSGLRSGDKLIEQMVAADERLAADETAQLRRVLTPVPAPSALDRCLSQIEHALERRDPGGLLDAIHTVVPQYRPSALAVSQIASATGAR